MEVHSTISFQGRVRWYDNKVFPFMCFWSNGVYDAGGYVGPSWPVLNNIPTDGVSTEFIVFWPYSFWMLVY